jgi:hypothetical protein
MTEPFSVTLTEARVHLDSGLGWIPASAGMTGLFFVTLAEARAHPDSG